MEEARGDQPPALEPERARVLVVDDDRLVRWSLRQRMEQEGHAVVEAATTAEARAQLEEEETDLVLLDVRLPDGDGLDLLDHIRARDRDLAVIMLTGHPNVEHAVRAIKRGAFHYARKPFELDEVALLVERALETTRLRREVQRLRRRALADVGADLVGESPQMAEIAALVRKVAVSPASTVLVSGESGTGKERVTRAIHCLSLRAEKPLVSINCSALPGTLLESELFGHEAGAFTDARSRKVGLIETASGGTLLLDEIGELELALQSKLLRVLEEKVFRRVGGTRDLRANVRIIAATNSDLKQAVVEGRFRPDLYYRLAVLRIEIPPLRERVADIAPLVKSFVDHFSREFDKDIASIAPAAMRRLECQGWPGNVRELRNAVERAVLLAEGPVLQQSDFDDPGDAPETAEFRLPAEGVDLRQLERNLVVQALERCAGNQTRAARLLGLKRDQIRYRIAKFGLS